MDEYSVRDLIEIILKRKWVIISITIFCLLVSGFLSFFILKPVYEAKTSIMITPIKIESGINPDTAVIFSGDPKSLDFTNALENKMLGAILNQVKYPQDDMPTVINYVNSTEFMNEILKVQNINSNEYDTKFQFDPTTGLATFDVKHGSPEKALGIMKAMIDYLPNYMLVKSNEKINYTEKMLNEGLNRELKNMDTLKTKVDGLISFAGGKDKIANLPIDKQNEYQNFSDDLNLTNQTIGSYQIVIKECMNIKSLDLIKLMNLQVINENKLPLSRISPKKTQNLAIGLIVGLMLGLFVVFVGEYWKITNMLIEKKNVQTKV